jgi:hypothetical protein
VFTGGVNTVVRRGEVLYRPARSTTSTVHRVLGHVRGEGFEQVPEPLGFDPRGREMVSFLPGRVHDRLPSAWRNREFLGSVARWIRRFHDASATYVSGPRDRWMLPPRSPAEVVCHGDLAPYNCVVEGDRLVGFIDFDTVHPAPRLWDLAYAVYRFAPLQAPTNPDSVGTPREQARLAAFLCREYGTVPGPLLLDTVVDRIEALLAHMLARAAEGDEAFRGHLDAGHGEIYEADLAYLRRHRSTFLEHLTAA